MMGEEDHERQLYGFKCIYGGQSDFVHLFSLGTFHLASFLEQVDQLHCPQIIPP